jgi:hypothetical protein
MIIVFLFLFLFSHTSFDLVISLAWPYLHILLIIKITNSYVTIGQDPSSPAAGDSDECGLTKCHYVT